MNKYRIITEPGNCIDTLYTVQRRNIWGFWCHVYTHTDLKYAEEYMKDCIRKRDFKKEVVISE